MQREYARVENFGSRFALAIIDFFAIQFLLSLSSTRGIFTAGSSSKNFGQVIITLVLLKGEAQSSKQCQSLSVILGGGYESDVHTTGAVNLIVIDFG